VDLPRMEATTLAIHTLLAIPTTNLFLFQMAMLESFDKHSAWKIYVTGEEQRKTLTYG
jgi:hypothetical protein